MVSRELRPTGHTNSYAVELLAATKVQHRMAPHVVTFCLVFYLLSNFEPKHCTLFIIMPGPVVSDHCLF